MPETDLQTFEDIKSAEFGELGVTDSSGPSALCISGGGIRSATFGLGAIQGLADAGVLDGFDYLSTVSGGGYIGAWLTSWKERAGGLNKILPGLRSGCPPPAPGTLDPIGHLRQFNNYLSPQLGFFSADTWTLAATVIRNMTLNWLVLIPLLLAAVMGPRIILSLGLLKDRFPGLVHEPFPGLYLSWLVRIAAAFFFAMAFFNAMRYLPGVGHRDHTQRDFLRWCLMPLILAALAFMTYDAWFDPDKLEQAPPLSFFGVALWTVLSAAAGWIAYLFLGGGKLARMKELWLGLTFAIVLTGFGTATAAWLLATNVFNAFYWWTSYIAWGPPLLLAGFLAAGTLFVGLTSRALGDQDREWLARGGAWVSIFMVCWLGVCGLTLTAPEWILNKGLSGWIQSGLVAAGGLSGLISAVAGFLSRSAPGMEERRPNGTPASAKSPLFDIAAKLAAPVFIALLLTGLSILVNVTMSATGLTPLPWKQHEYFVDHSRVEPVVIALAAFLLIGWAAARFINVNKFSLHAMYRSRLIRAYLGASSPLAGVTNFTGFTDDDNIFMGDLTPDLRPFHVVNVTLNLVGGDNLAWQQRKAESFTISPLHTGSSRLGYRISKQYGGPQGISLGTAITISGAAVSPSMGYHSSGAVGFIMTLFNARLGAWLGNPGAAGEKTWRQEGPTSAIGSLFREALGRTNDESAYVYLSDGGHFENLGLYEMVMRRCGLILVLDAGCDPCFTFEDLGNAMRKIRIDMGISIDFKSMCVPGKLRWGYADIQYSAIEPDRKNGVLIYVKPMITGDEAPDVTAYHNANGDFPHQSTGNQFYNESQTESYRMLGLHSIHTMCTGWDRRGGLKGMFDFVTGSATKSAGGSA